MKKKIRNILTQINNFERAVEELKVMGSRPPETFILYEQYYHETKGELLQAIINLMPDDIFDY